MSTKSNRRDRTSKSSRGPRAPRVDSVVAASNIIHMLGMHAGIETEFAKPLPESKRVESAIKYWMALHLIKTSPTLTDDTWRPLCEAINIGMIMCERGVRAEALSHFLDAQDAVTRAWARAGDRNAARLDGAGMKAIALALSFHDAQIESALRRDLAMAEREMLRRRREGNFVHAEIAQAA